MDKMMADKNSIDQQDTSPVQHENDWQSVLAHFQQFSSDDQLNVCPCPALKQAVEEIIRLKARLAQCQHMLFGQSSEKIATVLDKPEPASNVEDPPCADSQRRTLQEPQCELEAPGSPETEQDDCNASETPESVISLKSRRGAKPGHKGHGRRIPKDLSTIEVHIPVPDEQRFCKYAAKKAQRCLWRLQKGLLK